MGNNIKMFANSRPKYITTGIQNGLSIELQILLWSMIEEMRNHVEVLDYLQVFKMSIVEVGHGKMQKIIHSQEEPELNLEYTIPVEEPVECKIYIIDDLTHATMLFASEY